MRTHDGNRGKAAEPEEPPQGEGTADAGAAAERQAAGSAAGAWRCQAPGRGGQLQRRGRGAHGHPLQEQPRGQATEATQAPQAQEESRGDAEGGALRRGHHRRLRHPGVSHLRGARGEVQLASRTCFGCVFLKKVQLHWEKKQ